MRDPVKKAAEQEVVTSWRKVYAYLKRSGVASGIKRQIRRRERRAATKLTRLTREEMGMMD